MIPFLLNKNKSLATLVDDITAGIGEIADAYDGVATEEANGLKEVSFKLPISSPRYSQIGVGSWIKVKADQYHDLQIYEVYKVTRPINGIVTIYAEHISYMLGKATVTPFTSTGAVQTVQRMVANLVGDYPFTFETDIVNTTSNFALGEPMSFRKALGGWKGSVLDVFGGELDWDNLKVKLLAHRGADRGVRVEYGKNLTSLTQEESIANVYDAVIGYATVNDTMYVGDIQKITTTDTPRTQNVDFSASFDYEEQLTPEQIIARLNTLALAYAQNNDIGKPSVNLKVSFEPLSRFEEYQDIALLEQTGLFDTIYVLFPKLGVEAKAKIIRTQYDFINEKMISVELGDAKTNLLGLVDEQIESQISDIDIDTSRIEQAVGFLDTYVENLSQIITNSLGLFFTAVEKLDGSYQYYLHDKPNLADSMNQWTINAGGFALSTDGGQTWSAGIDAQGNAVLNSLSTVVLRALQIYGSYLRFGDVSSNYIDVAPYSSGNTPQGVSFDGTGSIRMQPKGYFYVNNIASDNVHYYNRIIMNKQGATYGSNNLTFNNNDDTQSDYPLANFFELNAHMNYDGSTYNRALLHNYATVTGTQYSANLFQMLAYSASNNIYIRNKKPANGDYNANQLTFTASTTSNTISLTNYKHNALEVANQFNLNHVSSLTRVQLLNRGYNYSTTANELTMESSGGGNTVALINKDNNDAVQNSIRLNSNKTNKIWSGNDLWLRSGGAVRIYANEDETTATGDYQNYGYTGSQQDLYLGGYSVKIQTMNRIYFYYNSTRYYLTCDSDGYVRCHSA